MPPHAQTHLQAVQCTEATQQDDSTANRHYSRDSPLPSSSLSSLMFMNVKGKVKDTCIFHPLVHLLSGHNSRGGDREKPGAWNFLWISLEWQGPRT